MFHAVLPRVRVRSLGRWITWGVFHLGRDCGQAERGLSCRWTADALLCGSPTRSARRSAGKHGDMEVETVIYKRNTKTAQGAADVGFKVTRDWRKKHGKCSKKD